MSSLSPFIAPTHGDAVSAQIEFLYRVVGLQHLIHDDENAHFAEFVRRGKLFHARVRLEELTVALLNGAIGIGPVHGVVVVRVSVVFAQEGQ